MNGFFSETIWLIPLYSLIGMSLSALWSPAIINRTGPRPAGYVNILLTTIAFFHSIFAFAETWQKAPVYQSVTWLQAAGLQITFDWEVSSLTICALILITGLNLVASIYAVGYLEMDWGWARFFALMGFFQGGMTTLVICNSLFFSYVVLEILTLGTYLLIGYWFNQSLVVTGARDAFLTKRVGDLFLLMAVVALLPLAGSWNYNDLANWAQTAHIDPTLATLLCLALIAGPLGKCAQFPLHLWLDEAMEGPMPATIIRNSLVVCTGAWVLIKLEPVFKLSPFACQFMIVIGALTAIGASLIAIAQIDIKRSLSYTASAYMGLVFIAVGTQQSQTTLLFLLSYAIAMALLVMSIGNVVLNSITQDLSQYGGLFSRRPITAFAYLVGAVSLVGVPPFGGFWTMAQMSSNLWEDHPILVGVLLLVNGLTSFSIIREFCLVFGGKSKPMTVRSPEGLWPLILPMTFVMGISLHLPLILSKFNILPWWDTLNINLAIALIISTVIGAGSSAFIYLNESISKPIVLKPKFVQDLFAYDLYTPQIYKVTIVGVVAIISNAIYWFDKYLIDGAVNLVGLLTIISGQSLKYNTSGQTQYYFLSILLGVALFVGIICLPLITPLF